MKALTVALVQLPAGLEGESALEIALDQAVAAASQGAQLVLLPELFAGAYFPRGEDDADFSRAATLDTSEPVTRLRAVAAQYRVAIPVSFFEREGPHYYNSVAFVNEHGLVTGVYRKSHIPDGPGYEEKFFFRPGNTGFKVFECHGVPVGVGICWDQWFPECARALALSGAELLLYPTAIGSEPHDPHLDTRLPWQRVMQGHAVANALPVLAANRVGTEGDTFFYGHSFICDEAGSILADLGVEAPKIALHTFDLEACRRYRAAFGFFRDRRPDLYTSLTTP